MNSGKKKKLPFYFKSGTRKTLTTTQTSKGAETTTEGVTGWQRMVDCSNVCCFFVSRGHSQYNLKNFKTV